MDFSIADIEALAKLLSPSCTQATADDDAIPISELTKPTPACIGPKDLLQHVKVAAPKALGRSSAQHAVSEASAALQDDEAEDADEDDGREVPEHTWCYKQTVTTADNFLGLSGKDPSCACCEQLMVVVQLPKAASARELRLDTSSTWIRLQSPNYRLRLALPHKVDEERGAAKWDGKVKALSITLPILRDLR